MLKEKGIGNDDLDKALTNNYQNLLIELYNNECKNLQKVPCRHRFSSDIWSLCLTLYFYSLRAYNFIRKRSILPHPTTLRPYLTKRKCYPGMLHEVLKHLAKQKYEHLKNVAFIFDGMKIRKFISYDPARDRNVGYVDLGGIETCDSEELASEALFFQIVSYLWRTSP